MTLMLEEYLDGPEVDVDLVISEGQVGLIAMYSWFADFWKQCGGLRGAGGLTCEAVLLFLTSHKKSAVTPSAPLELHLQNSSWPHLLNCAAKCLCRLWCSWSSVKPRDKIIWGFSSAGCA